MNKELQDKVHAIATKVRQWTEDRASRANFNMGDLCGWCAIASAQLQREFIKNKIVSEIHYNTRHCFVVVDDYVVDVTATQFSDFKKFPVLIIHSKEVESEIFYTTHMTFKYPSELRDYQLRENWPKRQIAYTR